MAATLFQPDVADKVPPETTITKGPGKKLDKGKAKFKFESSEANSSFMCKLDGEVQRPPLRLFRS